MALTGLQIFKLLPNTNCKECGFPTCLAFAMKLAAKQVQLDLCPYASEEAKQVLGLAATPPIRRVVIGTEPRAVTVGEETVLFRHDKTFFHKTALAPVLIDTQSPDEFKQNVDTLFRVSFERAGETLRVDLLGIKERSGDKERFGRCVEMAAAQTDMPLALISDNPEIMMEGLRAVPRRKPLIVSANERNWNEMTALSLEHNAPLVVSSNDGLRGLVDLIEKVTTRGAQNIVLDPGSKTLGQSLRDQTIIRRAAIEKNVKSLGYPTLLRLDDPSAEPYYQASMAAQGICKYASIILIEGWDLWEMLPLLTLRQNIFTDPQKPLQVNAGLYPIGSPNSTSPLYVTTNFSLTYFIVASEIEGTGLPSYLLVADAEGMSVLTAWSAGKFGGEIVGKAVKESGIETQLAHRNVIIPGYVSSISGDLEEALPGWNVIIGPQEASDLGAFVKDVWLTMG